MQVVRSLTTNRQRNNNVANRGMWIDRLTMACLPDLDGCVYLTLDGWVYLTWTAWRPSGRPAWPSRRRRGWPSGRRRTTSPACSAAACSGRRTARTDRQTAPPSPRWPTARRRRVVAGRRRRERRRSASSCTAGPSRSPWRQQGEEWCVGRDTGEVVCRTGCEKRGEWCVGRDAGNGGSVVCHTRYGERREWWVGRGTGNGGSDV